MIDKQFLNGCGINVTGSDSLVIDYLNDDDISYKYEQEDSLHRDYEIESMFNHFINRAE